MFDLLWEIITLPFEMLECFFSCLFILMVFACCILTLLLVGAF